MLFFLDPTSLPGAPRSNPRSPRPPLRAEYRALGYTVAETIWVRKLLYDLGVTLSTPVRLYCDNLSATYLSANSVQHDRSKHIAVGHHFVQERVVDGDLVIRYIPIKLQTADIFTKGLSAQQFMLHRTIRACTLPIRLRRRNRGYIGYKCNFIVLSLTIYTRSGS